MTRLRASCACTSAVMLRSGRAVCASCQAPLSVEAEERVVFTTNAGEWPPTARSRRHARDLIRRVPEHERSGFGRTTAWKVESSAFHRFYVAPIPSTVDCLAAIGPDAWIERAGYRVTR